MTSPLSRSHELGRAIGYNIDVQSVLAGLNDASEEGGDALTREREMNDRIAQAAAGIALKHKVRAKRLWVVVKIENDVPVMLDAYEDKRSATLRENFLLRHARPEIDTVRMIGIDLASKTKNATTRE